MARAGVDLGVEPEGSAPAGGGDGHLGESWTGVKEPLHSSQQRGSRASPPYDARHGAQSGHQRGSAGSGRGQRRETKLSLSGLRCALQ